MRFQLVMRELGPFMVVLVYACACVCVCSGGVKEQIEGKETGKGVGGGALQVTADRLEITYRFAFMRF